MTSTNPAPDRASHVLRGIGAVVVFAVAAAVTQLPLALSGAAGSSGGWLAAFLFLTPAAALAALVLRRSTGFGRACAVFLPLALALGIVVAHDSPLSPEGVEQVATDVGPPAGWSSGGATTGGNSVCVDVCSYAIVTWTGGGQDADARVAAARAHLQDEGFRVEPGAAPTTGDDVTLRRGDVTADLTAGDDRPEIRVRFTWDAA